MRTALVLKLKSPLVEEELFTRQDRLSSQIKVTLVEEELFTRQDRLSSQIKVTISRGGTVYPSGPP